MPRRKKTPEDEKNIALLRSQNDMYKKTLEEAKLRGNTKAIEQIENAQKEMAMQASQVEPELTKELMDDFNNSQKEDVYTTMRLNSNDDRTTDVFSQFEEIEAKESSKDSNDKENIDDNDFEITDEIKEESINDDTPDDINEETGSNFNGMETNTQFDVIPLPSNGECYPSKKSRLPVAYLTAYDENLITSPNLYRDGLVIDYLLKNKVLDKDFDIEDLVTGDADAIILFLRATSYGTDFPISVKDPTTGKMIDSTVDLSKLKTKEFKLKGDSEGHFEFTLPVTKKKVKFKYLTRKEEKMLEKLNRFENDGIRATSVRGVVDTIKSLLKSEELLDGKEKQIILDSTKNYTKWAEKIEQKNRSNFSKSITNRMEFQIVEFDGKKDRKSIHDAVINMPARDALMLRRYIIENEPGIDFEITVQRPESLGGGSFKTFLEWDDTVFLNIS